MPNVFVEPRPKARADGAAIEDYVLEYAGEKPVDGKSDRTQSDAIAAAKALGHKPSVSRLRHAYKGKPDQWREA